MLSLLDVTSSKGFGQKGKSLKMGEGQAEWGCGRERSCHIGAAAHSTLRLCGQESDWAEKEEQGLSFSLAQPVKFRLFP